MSRENIIKRMQELEEDEDFVVGTIAGLEQKEEVPRASLVRHLPKKQTIQGDDVAMTTQTIENNVVATTNVTPESLEGTVMLKLNKQYKKLVDTIVKNNDNVVVQDLETHYQINAPQIKVTRQDGERALGKLNDGKWRMLFVNKKGEVVDFNDDKFVLGVIEAEVEEAKELAQLNTRIDSKCKLDMDEIRDLLGMTQAKFLEVAINEYVGKVRDEIL